MALPSNSFGKNPLHTKESLDTIRQNIAEKKAILLDVRSQKERDAGHVKGSVFIPITAIKELPAGTSELPELSKDQIIYCH